MITDWLIPTSIIPDLVAENSDWEDLNPADNVLQFPLITKEDLNHVAMHDLAYTSKAGDVLIFSGINVPAYTSIQGIEVTLDIRRRSRITDYVLQFYLGNVAVSENMATQDASRPNQSTYGSSTTNWNIDPSVNLQDPTFNLRLQVGPHPSMPSRDPAIIDKVAVRITYS